MGLSQRHARTEPIGSRLIGGRGNHTTKARLTANHHWPTVEHWGQCPLHGDEKGIKVNMNDLSHFHFAREHMFQLNYITGDPIVKRAKKGY